MFNNYEIEYLTFILSQIIKKDNQKTFFTSYSAIKKLIIKLQSNTFYENNNCPILDNEDINIIRNVLKWQSNTKEEIYHKLKICYRYPFYEEEILIQELITKLDSI